MQWTASMQLDGLDFVDHLVPLSHTQQLIRVKTDSVAPASAPVSLNINKGKNNNVPKCDTVGTNQFKTDGEALEEAEAYTYLGSIVDKQGGLNADVKTRIGKTTASFL